VVREVREETALAVTCGRFIGWVERIGEGHHFVIMDFWAQRGSDRPPGDGPTEHAQAGDDAAEVAWVPLDELTRFDLVDGLEEFLVQHGVLDQENHSGSQTLNDD
jgi:ADP-ribose pyrophosphatase YjhB (NUDIX family)